jgi:hypothetical protein
MKWPAEIVGNHSLAFNLEPKDTVHGKQNRVPMYSSLVCSRHLVATNANLAIQAPTVQYRTVPCQNRWLMLVIFLPRPAIYTVVVERRVTAVSQRVNKRQEGV